MSKKPTCTNGSKKVAAPLRQLTKASQEGVSRQSVDGLAPATEALVLDIGRLIEVARGEVAQTANAALTTLYWTSANPAKRHRWRSSSVRERSEETVEILDLGKSGIHVAEYLTELPPREILHDRFHRALATARARLEQHAFRDEGAMAKEEG